MLYRSKGRLVPVVPVSPAYRLRGPIFQLDRQSWCGAKDRIANAPTGLPKFTHSGLTNLVAFEKLLERVDGDVLYGYNLVVGEEESRLGTRWRSETVPGFGQG
jgi:hypothetical protein